MTKPRATWVLWLLVEETPDEYEWKALCSASPGYYFKGKEVLQMVASKWGWPDNMYRILPAGRRLMGRGRR